MSLKVEMLLPFKRSLGSKLRLKNNQGQGSIRLDPRTRKGGTPSSTFCREASSFSCRSYFFITARKHRKRKRLSKPMRMTPPIVYMPRTYNLLLVFIQKSTQLRCSMKLHVSASKPWGYIHDHFKIIATICIYSIGYFFYL